jgi:chemotaxis protein histidine kinase CheA
MTTNANAKILWRLLRSVLFLHVAFSSAAFADTASDAAYSARCQEAFRACKAKDAACSTYREAFNSEGSACPGVNEPSTAPIMAPGTLASTSDLAPTSKAIAPPSAVPTPAPDKLQASYQLCTPHNNPPSTAIPCIKALLNASQDPIFNARDPAVQLYVLEADKLLANIEHKHLSEAAAREKLLRLLFEAEDRHRPQIEAEMARQASLRASQDQEAAQQRMAAEAREQQRATAEAVEQQHREAAEAARQAQNQEAQRRHDDAVAFCVDTADDRLHANPTYANGYIGLIGFPIGHTYTNINRVCSADPNWYKNLPTVPVRITLQ